MPKYKVVMAVKGHYTLVAEYASEEAAAEAAEEQPLDMWDSFELDSVDAIETEEI